MKQVVEDSVTEISVIVPVYNSIALLRELCERLSETIEKVTNNYQIILVDDCGPEPVWPVIEMLCQEYAQITGLKLSRNFGQHAAITAGLSRAHSNWYVVMDCDLQDRPEDIYDLYQKAKNNDLDSVVAFRKVHQVSFIKKLGSKFFNFLLNKLASVPTSSDIGNFRIFNHKMAEAYREYADQMRLFPAIMAHLGFEIGVLEVKRPKRQEGVSNYSFKKLLKLAFDSIVSNTIKPVYFMAIFGVLVSFLSLLFAVSLIVRTFFMGIQAEGWTSIMLAITFFGGVQIFAVSFVGIYVGKVFFEVKRRPIYIISKSKNIKGRRQ